MVAISSSPVRLALAFLSLTGSLVSALPKASSTTRGLFPQDPTNDPFYQPPVGFENEAPGTILRNRSVVASFFGLVPNPVEAHQLLYRTTAINGSAISTVTTIFKPLGAKTDRFVSFHTAYDSSSINCTPSYQYQLGTPQTSLIASVEMLIIEAYLLMGYIVASPDYEGPDAAFSPGHLEGMGVLDGMRAVSSFHSTLGLDNEDPMIVGVGYSGGAIASGWAASLQAGYAPELDVKGWVAGGTPSNLTGTLLLLDDSAFSGFIPAAIVGLSAPSAYGAQLAPVINRIITDEGREKLEAAATQCAVADLVTFFEQSLFDTSIQTLGRGILDQPTIKQVLEDNVMGVKKSETPMAPMFVYHATGDEVIPYADASTTVDSWCNNGVDVKFTTFESGGHATTEVIALPNAIKFVEAAFEGSTETGCSSDTELANKLNPLALGDHGSYHIGSTYWA
ncbi:secretory lipase-domain-containing protein [Aspergillus ambiguus]|uniref:secretory lipase-domain-containing protein n=1 Tax=Aspergillus ambiguus TaxID=176160 RepID=UPI003CCD2D63